MSSINNLVDVAIVGFGPVGAALAGLLGRRGVRVLVLERDPEVFPMPRAAHVDHTGLRTWQEIGVLDRLLPGMKPNAGLRFVNAKDELLAAVASAQGSLSGLPPSMYFFQPVLDRMVRDFVSGFPTVGVELGTTVTALEEVDGGVRIQAVDVAGAAREFSASWLVACDGPSSAVRTLLDIGFEDLRFEESWFVVDLVLAEGVERDADYAVCICDPTRPTYSIPMPFNRHRFEFKLMPEDDPAAIVRPERIQELIGRWFPAGSAEVERNAIYTFHGLVADRWRQGRVLLAGDAVHQMPPFLGQGMCSGLRDATNLAWKLDAVISGIAGDSLLDTYELERRNHVRAVVEAAVSLGRFLSLTDPVEAERRDREMLTDSRPPEQRTAFALPDLVPGPLVLDGGGELFVQPRGFPRFDDVVGERFALISANPEILASAAADRWRESGAFVSGLDDLPDQHQGTIRRWLQSRGSEAVIVRPDRYVLWSGADLDVPAKALARLLADPVGPI